MALSNPWSQISVLPTAFSSHLVLCLHPAGPAGGGGQGSSSGFARGCPLEPSTKDVKASTRGESGSCEGVLLAQLPPVPGLRAGGTGSDSSSPSCWQDRCCVWGPSQTSESSAPSWGFRFPPTERMKIQLRPRERVWGTHPRTQLF